MKGRAIAAAHENAIFADQHYNPRESRGALSHDGTGDLEQTEGKVTHFVCAPGTGGTVSGAGKYLKEKNPRSGCRGDPAGSIYTDYAKTRSRPMASPTSRRHRRRQDSHVAALGCDRRMGVVSDKDAMQMARRLSKEEGLFVGGSTGVNLVAALDVARRLDDPKALVVTVLADTGERYLSKVYNEEWLRENQLIDDERPTVGRLIAAKNSDAPPLIHVARRPRVRQRSI